MSIFPITSFSQAEQTGGFWLISLKLSVASPKAQAFDIGCLFGFDSDNQTLPLFQQTPSESEIQLQLLSQQAISAEKPPEQLFVRQPTIKNSSSEILSAALSSPNLLILGSELPMANLFYLAKQRSDLAEGVRTIALLHSQQGFPFAVKPALFMTPDLPAEAIGTSSLLEDWKITNRLASDLGLPGCFDGSLSEIFAFWASNQPASEAWKIVACTPLETQKKYLEISQQYSWIDFIGIQYS